jgi:hypothetical protein
MKTPAIVTKQSLQQMLNDASFEKQQHIIGRAVVALFNRQTESEKNANSTEVNNNVGFTHADSRGGSMTAKSYMKRHGLQDWQVVQWTRKQKNGFARICKYHTQLNEIAIAKVQKQLPL